MQRKLDGSMSRISSTVSAARPYSSSRTCVIIFSWSRSTSCCSTVGAFATALAAPRPPPPLPAPALTILPVVSPRAGSLPLPLPLHSRSRPSPLALTNGGPGARVEHKEDSACGVDCCARGAPLVMSEQPL